MVGVLSATDPDADSTFTYTLSGNDAASFSVDGDELKSAEVFDFETKASYNITVTVSDGELTFDQDFTVTVEDVEETVLSVGSKFEIRVYPNPTTDKINVDVADLQKLQLLDLSGKVLIENNNSVLNVGNFKNGLYLLKVQTIDGADVRKILINH